jgi:PAS domain S-box-containing protein
MKTLETITQPIRPSLKRDGHPKFPVEIIWTTDESGNVYEDCPSWRAFSGQTLEQLEGKGWLAAVHSGDRERCLEIWDRAAETGSVFETKIRARRADGEWRTLSVHGIPVREFGTIHRWVGFCRDVTERVDYIEKLMHERHFSNDVIECLPGVFYMVDESGKMLRWNENLEKTSGYSHDEIAQMHGKEFLLPSDHQRADNSRKRIVETGEYRERETEFLKKDGKTIPFYFDARRVTFEGKACVMGIGVDITDLKEAEQELRRANEILEARVVERTRDLEQSYKELEAFSYSVSHDLRAPLQAIQGFTEILKEDYFEQLQGEGQELLQRILQCDARMTRLINDVLRYSRMGHTAIKLEPIPLAQMIRYAKTDFELRLREIGGEIHVEPDLPTVSGDLTLLNQVFCNLFQNAINYRRKDVPLVVNVRSLRENSDVVIAVADNGIGIAAENQEKVFQAFFRLHGDKTVPGNGLGLATVKKAVDRMGGRIWIDSQPDTGTTFFIRLKPA